MFVKNKLSLEKSPLKKIDVKEICRGRRVVLLQKIFETHDGEKIFKDVINFGEAVAIVPMIDDDHVVLIKQYRAPIERWIHEIPAGKVESGEDTIDAVKRELIEETGYMPREIIYLKSIYTAPGYSDEIIHIFIAKDLVYVGSKPEKGEIIETKIYRLSDAIDIVLKEDPSDVKTLVGLLLAKENLKRIIDDKS